MERVALHYSLIKDSYLPQLRSRLLFRDESRSNTRTVESGNLYVLQRRAKLGTKCGDGHCYSAASSFDVMDRHILSREGSKC